ncbi:MAG: hypothetical protein WAV09_04860 [Minisyncoccia bacterium]
MWKTIKLGTNLKTSDDFRAALKQMRVHVSKQGNNIFRRKRPFIVSEEEVSMNLTSVSVEDLGFPEWTLYRDIIAKAMSLGLRLCPAEIGPQLRLQCTDQLNYNYIVAMEPIITSDEPIVFMVHDCRNKRLCLNTVSANPDVCWDTRYRFVFLCPN